ncbi:MAG: glycosyltransferase [Phenylobacterium sp.]|uniref:glycosyltransferase n=1 Tax=Phenylobacterium sp. TaxID=1871053 RepID=UPI001B57D942|nr:glycosyltransferase [Phenylobacterium sp.]MBP7649195.1 glycosyltransferase [Phenylobacterium sp.]MBP7815955.1 glycosyltransferase [Phenylobacterium sp.]MBP9231845.1 glycosyltransferase [Phenylobacterium sp.]MBP9755362.1 glycosyltransferase [Phenylobacterium sp.]
MLSVIIPTFNSSTHLQELLPVLVPAAVDGLVREVMAADEGSTDPTLMICDDAGVEVVTDGIAQAMKRARQDWILLLPPDIRLTHDWADRVARGIKQGRSAGLKGQSDAGSLLDRLKPGSWGLLVRKSELGNLAPGADMAGLRRQFGRLATLK